jgi:hypothetical protein
VPAREQYVNTIARVNAGVLEPLSNVQVTVKLAGTETNATIYQARTGAAQGPSPSAGAVGTNPFTTGASGAVAFWADQGEYDIEIHDLNAPARIADVELGWTSSPAFLVGTIALRPTAGQLGRYYFATDQGLIYFDTGSAWVSKTFRIGHTFAMPGEIRVPSGDSDHAPTFFVPVASGQSVKLVGIRHMIRAGTQVTYKVQKNGADLPAAWLGLTADTTPETIDPSDVALADLDRLGIVVTAVTGTPRDLSVTLILEHAIA